MKGKSPRRVFVILFYLICIGQTLFGQISGVVSDESGNPLPYANIYVINSSQGTSSNENGKYTLEMENGSYQIVYQHIGYEPFTLDVILKDQQKIDVQLNQLPHSLAEVVVSAQAEDPAYEVIRKAIKRRKYYRDLHKSYRCQAYTKGLSKILNAPEKILGQEVGDFDGSLDSTRSGIVYFSESVSDLYYQHPNQYYEEVHASKVSGDDNGYSFNSAKEMIFNLYRNNLEFGRDLVSPISDAAFSFYNYKLLNTYYDEQQHEINVIEVIPKLGTTPCYSGIVHIVEGSFNFKYLELSATKEATKIWVLDTITLRQTFNLDGENYWNLAQSHVNFAMNFLGFEFEGNFLSDYYNYRHSIDSFEFGSISHLVTEESNKKDIGFWDSIRTIPLTISETTEYVRKDSIYQMRHSDRYLDSIDRESRVFKAFSPLVGYYPKSSKTHTDYHFEGLLSGLGYNTVQGATLSTKFSINDYDSEQKIEHFKTNGYVGYGLGNQQLNVFTALSFERFDKRQDKFIVEGGRRYVQFNRSHGIPNALNSIWTLLLERNYAKFYQLSDLRLAYQKQYFNGLSGYFSIAYEHKRAATNSIMNSLIEYENREFTSNNPLLPNDDVILFEDNKGLFLSADFRFKFGQRYIGIGKKYYKEVNYNPLFHLALQKAIPINQGDPNYNHISMGVVDELSLGSMGTLQYSLNAGTFIDFRSGSFAEFHHFRGSQMAIVNSSIKSFLALPYYNASTNQEYFEMHLRHKFDGFLMDRIPALNKLGLSILAQYNLLTGSNQSTYQELALGLDNLGFGRFKMFRFWVVKPISTLSDQKWVIRIGVPLLD